MSHRDDGGDAFPTFYDQDGGVRYPGMSLLAYFASKMAMRTMGVEMSMGDGDKDDCRKRGAEEAVAEADALIEALKR